AGALTCVHDLSDGGLIGAAADIALASDCGVELDATSATHAHILLFGEDQARYLVAVADATEIIAAAQAAGLHASVVGRAKGRDFASGDLFRLPLDHLREMHEGWMPGWIEAVA
ncbi:MAG: AIR synthase-related protein, partial [Brevundimonas sp.]